MASGKLGSAALVANTDTTLYEVPAGKTATFNIACVNRGSTVAGCKLAISDTDTPEAEDYIEYGAKITASGGVFERTAIVASAGEKVVINCTTEGVSARVYGFEE